MSEQDKAMVIERMAQLPEHDRTFIMGVLAGLAVKQERRKDRDAAGDDGRGAAESGEGAEG
jgi:hypothetical protein